MHKKMILNNSLNICFSLSENSIEVYQILASSVIDPGINLFPKGRDNTPIPSCLKRGASGVPQIDLKTLTPAKGVDRIASIEGKRWGNSRSQQLQKE
jgi:hypothetical protein